MGRMLLCGSHDMVLLGHMLWCCGSHACYPDPLIDSEFEEGADVWEGGPSREPYSLVTRTGEFLNHETSSLPLERRSWVNQAEILLLRRLLRSNVSLAMTRSEV